MKTVHEIKALGRCVFPYIVGSFVKINERKYPCGDGLYISQISDGSGPNLLLLPGGCIHQSVDHYYLKLVKFLHPDARVFVLQRKRPLLSYQQAEDISPAISYIKQNYSGPVYLVGFSMGGVCLMSYLLLGRDEADAYFAISAPLELETFLPRVQESRYFSRLIREACEQYGQKSFEDLCRYHGVDPQEQEEYCRQFYSRLVASQPAWNHKFTLIIGKEDIALPDPRETARLLNGFSQPLKVIYIDHASHCCMKCLGQTYLMIKGLQRHGNVEDAYTWVNQL